MNNKSSSLGITLALGCMDISLHTHKADASFGKPTFNTIYKYTFYVLEGIFVYPRYADFIEL